MVEFNPSKTEKSVITVRIENGLLREIDDLSAKVDISRNEFIIQCIDFAMKHYPKIQKRKWTDTKIFSCVGFIYNTSDRVAYIFNIYAVSLLKTNIVNHHSTHLFKLSSLIHFFLKSYIYPTSPRIPPVEFYRLRYKRYYLDIKLSLIVSQFILGRYKRFRRNYIYILYKGIIFYLDTLDNVDILFM